MNSDIVSIWGGGGGGGSMCSYWHERAVLGLFLELEGEIKYRWMFHGNLS
jgi:hypothetical protein